MIQLKVHADGSSEYLKITIDYPVAAARSFASLSDNFKFVYISGDGTEKRSWLISEDLLTSL
jgi:hypothetical protein